MPKGRILSFRHAFEGIWTAFKEEPNLKFHFLVMTAVIVAGFYFDLRPGEWLAIIFSIGLVLTLELTNTAIETIVDSFTQKDHPSAKRAKDIASGAVLTIALTAAVVGSIVFLPHLIKVVI